MFNLSLEILRNLHEEHAAMLALLERLEKLLAAHGPEDPPDTGDADTAALLEELATTLSEDVTYHYAFEENHLFPRFGQAFDPGIPEMLRQEHELIRPLAGRLVAAATAAKEGGFDATGWSQFHAAGHELVEREVFHIQKEEMGFLPGLDRILEPSDDAPLLTAYGEIKSA
ncbi:MAG: hemerythrin domain-containing protein [Alphaproteobacteria bacterium]|jgi:hemerythrin-like domain-containing protein|nr:hemerythrin domain-containing protein [Alphaproteobacteria bacterium]MDP7123611.1 hemerythrin domain-containing protein [Alphaproteobacteria bacterium]MDP7469180.1 hemerythrin domain-containing protein [Alphaproteobacteria bacterium]MDP7543884.1 hemerythrin domain-containing protein [Alphaproteobacteria bacterium]MDP7670037.1 hemerythrin domain-containing protein [Alphaproteobacteria bacterium]|tara:strand:- start:577 stop:1089 length:513 start_codon:yes stop_codon:yes gene_type:complete